MLSIIIIIPVTILISPPPIHLVSFHGRRLTPRQELLREKNIDVAEEDDFRPQRRFFHAHLEPTPSRERPLLEDELCLEIRDRFLGFLEDALTLLLVVVSEVDNREADGEAVVLRQDAGQVLHEDLREGGYGCKKGASTPTHVPFRTAFLFDFM